MNIKGGTMILIMVLSGFFCWQNIFAANLININSANLEVLDALPGIGPAKAQAIIEYREVNGEFAKVEDLMNVSGIGETTFANIRDLITVVEDTGSGDVGAVADEAGSGAGSEQTTDNSEQEENTDENNSAVAYKLGDIVINELVSDPTDGEVEWVELSNNLNAVLDLGGWYLQDGSGAKTTLSGTVDKFFVIEKPKGNLNNSGDLVELYYQNELIDRLIYGDWIGTDRAPAASDPNSLARTINGRTTYNNQRDFSVTSKPTKGAGNLILAIGAAEDEAATEERADYDFSDDVVVSEIFPNPPGDDATGEFIELFNSGSQDVDLQGWRLGDNSEKRFEIKQTRVNGSVIKVGDYLAFKREETKIALNNDVDEVKLFQPLTDNPCVRVKYEKAAEKQGYDWNPETKKYVWSDTITPGLANKIAKINRAPAVSFDYSAPAWPGIPVRFDSSDTIDEDNSALSFLWEFGDKATNSLANPEHTYFTAGAYSVKLTVSDGINAAAQEKIILVGQAKLETITATTSSVADIIINEIMPAPAGADEEEEWIELYNRGAVRVNLLDWRVDDREGGSRPYSFKDEFMLEAGRYFLLKRLESGLALNDTGDEVRLFNPQESLVDSLVYDKAAAAESYARGENGKWFWTVNPTPAAPNVIKIASSQAVNEEMPRVLGVSYNAATDELQALSLAEIRKAEIGAKALVHGTVICLPGVLGAQFFYIADKDGGLQVYNYKKDFPELKLGDYLEIVGEVSESQGERRLKTKVKADLKVLEQREVMTGRAVKIQEISEENIGELLLIEGEAVDRKATTIYFDDGSEEIKVYIKSATNIIASAFEEGAHYAITGILANSSAGLRFLPRSPADIIRQDSSVPAETQVIGEVPAAAEWELAQRDHKLELFKYLLAIAGFLIILLIGILIKLKRK